MSKENFCVKCMKAPEGEPTNELKEAHEILVENGFKTLWITPSECLDLEEKDKDVVYLVDPFEGEAFHHLAALRCRVYGPQAILSCLLMRMEMPKRRVPIYNMAMKDILISCTSIDKDQRETLHEKVEYMAGEVSKDFTEGVTHLIAGEVGSKKYLVAGSLGKHIMTVNWVQAVWEKARYRHVHATDDQFQKYKCPIFAGLVVTVSGLDQDERKDVKKILEAEGGKYTGEMKMSECTHLIIKEAKGQKYEHARKWKISIVKPKWLYDSLEKSYCLDEANYKLEKDLNTTSTDQRKTSTPNKEKTTISASHLGDISNISNISVIAAVNETAAALQKTQLAEPPDKGIGALEALDVTSIPGDLFLDGCKFYLSGFRGPNLEKLRKIINAGGGTRFNTINESVTHVLMGEKIPADIDLLRNSDHRPHVVRADWLVECYKKVTTVDVEPYLCLDLPALDPASPKLKGKKKAGKSVPVRKSVDEDATQEPQTDDMEEILSQYLPQDTTKTAAPTTAEENEQTDINKAVDNKDFDEVDGSKLPTDEPDQGQGIFHKKSFMFFGFDEDLVTELAAFINERGGKVVAENRRMVADYAIVPIDGFQVSVTVNEVLTSVWLQMCIEEEKVLHESENELFHPIDIAQNIDDLLPLKNCVLSISGFVGTERDCLLHIAGILGAECQEYFVRRPVKGLHASTHLLVKEPSGTKYETAKKWKLPAVSKFWLFACAKSGRREPEEEFTIDKLWSNKNSSTEVPKILPKSNTTSKSIPKECALTANCDNVNVTNVNNNNVQLDVKRGRTIKHENSLLVPDAQIPSSSSSDSQVVADPMSGAKSLLEKDKVRKDSQKENIATAADATNRPQHSRVKELQQDKALTPKLSSPSNVGIDTPGKFLDPGVTFMPKFNLAAAFDALQSPEGDNSKNHKRSSSMSFTELYGKHLKLALENSSVKRSDEGQQVSGTSNTEDEVSAPLRGVVIAVSKKLLLNQAEYNKIVTDLGGFYSWEQDSTYTHFIFQGRANDTSKEFRLARDQGKTIVSPHWLYACQTQSQRVDEGQFPHNYNPNLSLVVSGGKTPGRTPGRPTRRTGRSARKASDKDEDKKQTKTEDSVKPIEQKSPPNMPEEKQVEHEDRVQDEASKHDKEEESEMPKKNTDEVHVPMMHDIGGTLEIREELSKQMEAIMSSAGKTKKLPRKRSKRLDSSGQFNTSGNTSDSGKSRPSSRQSPWSFQDEKKDTGRKTRSSSKGSDSASAPEASQSVQVTWDDPTGRLEQEKLADELQRMCTQSQNTDDYLAGIDLSNTDNQFSEMEDTAKEQNTSRTRSSSSKRKSPENRTPTPEAPPLAFPEPKRTTRVMSPEPVEILDEEHKKKRKPPVILVSGMQHNERVDYGALVEQLGGKLLDYQYFDPSCTHLVVEVPARNEKFLACVASGKWVLHKSYFEACRKEGTFVKEEGHEWGSEATKGIMLNMNAQSSKLAAAANRWREKVKEMKKLDPSCRGAFEGWQVILCTDKNREGNFARLLQAGGAQVLSVKPPFDSDVHATHAFLELNKIKLSQDDLETLITADILCLKPEFISAHLTEDPAANPEDYFPPEVTALRASLPDNVPKKRKNVAAESSGKRARRQ